MNQPQQKTPIEKLIDEYEKLLDKIVDLEAMAHAAAEVLQHIPYLPRRSESPDEERLVEIRRQFGRLHALVAATSDSARKVLDRAHALSERLNEFRKKDRNKNGEDRDENNSNGRNGGVGQANERLAPYAGVVRRRSRGNRTGGYQPPKLRSV
ncbi:MAG: hypothetical protein MJE77_16575 [Proteobacteria bacterium]|nr:hypothetical protein [Pseudomonadota bacterium]